MRTQLFSSLWLPHLLLQQQWLQSSGSISNLFLSLCLYSPLCVYPCFVFNLECFTRNNFIFCLPLCLYPLPFTRCVSDSLTSPSPMSWPMSWRSATLSSPACSPWRWSWSWLPLASLSTWGTPITSLMASLSSSGLQSTKYNLLNCQQVAYPKF